MTGAGGRGVWPTRCVTVTSSGRCSGTHAGCEITGGGGQLSDQAVDLPTAQSVAAIDPSEAIRAAEIVPVLRHYFEIVEYKPMDGSILQFLLADIAGNFADEEGRKLLDMLFIIEDTLMAVGDLGSDFAYIVAAPKAMQG
jgi:hypothetical protein